MDSFRYHKRGVSSDKSEVHEAIKGMSSGLYANTFCKILPDIFSKDETRCSIIHADTVGTKGILAYLEWKETGSLEVWKRLAQDAMVMNIDDMLCSGCLGPFLVSSTIGRNKSLISGAVIGAIIQGNQEFIDAMNELGIETHSAGGETADVGDVVKTIDTGITVSSVFDRADVIELDLQAGNFIVGMASYGQSSYEKEYNSGISCNGLTSARHDLLSSHYRQFTETFDATIPDDLIYSGPYLLSDEVEIEGSKYRIGDLITAPTRTFAPVLNQVLKSHRASISGIIHNTGGAHTKVSKFAEGLKVIKDNLLPIAPIFDLIQEASGTSSKEMFQIFNMGTRMEVYCSDKETADSIVAISQSFNIDAAIIGRVESKENENDPTVVVDHEKGLFEY